MQEFFVTVDLVVLTIRDDRLQVLVVERKYPPYQGDWALPGLRGRRGGPRGRRLS